MIDLVAQVEDNRIDHMRLVAVAFEDSDEKVTLLVVLLDLLMDYLKMALMEAEMAVDAA